jgi:hypothetical protein
MRKKIPIAHWSHSSLMGYLRNPLAWYTRYVEHVYDTPKTPASIVGIAGHKALEHFYSGTDKELAIRLGKEELENVPDFEINFGKARSRREKKERREGMVREYERAIAFYLERPPRHTVLGVEVRGIAKPPGHRLPVKAVSDLVVASRGNLGGVDIVDHKFVESFGPAASERPVFMLQAIFNYYTVQELFERPIHRFIVYECKKTKNTNGAPQLRKHVFLYKDMEESFQTFHRLLKDATADLATRKVFLPNPSDMFEGAHSFQIYTLGLVE